ncbi:MAG: dTMP kinase [Deltaproteobacteria bacterium]|nr:dTMP kinase [Deltaproteobacteria bacterium]MBW1846447.1 dTMP kinase [Deltaproteobacteria bacterium]
MFITLEGIEGSGKTTQIRHIAEYIKSKGQDCVITREPGGTGIGKKIRTILLDSNSKGLDPSAELLLYVADRVQHVNEVIRPALSLGKIVLCDRYFDATVAYQGFARGIDMDLITMLHKRIVENLRPDITILLDLPAETGLKRAWEQINNGARTSAETRFEEEKITFHENVRAGYLELARMDPERFRIIDAAGNEKTVKEDILEALPL